VTAAFRPRLVIMLKEPKAGRVKSRLARDIGAILATHFYRETMNSTAWRLGNDPRWQTILAVSPDAAIASAMIPVNLARIRQQSGGLGQRLQRVVQGVPPGPVVIIGTDIPGIMPSEIWAAFGALGSHDAVFGPASDGGYWLVGLKRRPSCPRIFDGVRWSTAFALSDTKANLKGMRVTEICGKDDVDDGRDLARLAHLTGRRFLGVRSSRSD
jgi:uncharacterized protein